MPAPLILILLAMLFLMLLWGYRIRHSGHPALCAVPARSRSGADSAAAAPNACPEPKLNAPAALSDLLNSELQLGKSLIEIALRGVGKLETVANVLQRAFFGIYVEQ